MRPTVSSSIGWPPFVTNPVYYLFLCLLLSLGMLVWYGVVPAVTPFVLWCTLPDLWCYDESVLPDESMLPDEGRVSKKLSF